MEIIKKLNNIDLPEDFNIKYINENEFDIKDIKKAIELYIKDKNENSYKELKFTIYGDTKAWRRATPTKTHVFDPNVSIKQDIRVEVFRQLKLLGYDNFTPKAGEFIVHMDVYKPMLKSLPKYKKILAEAGIIKPKTKPDIDNYLKLLFDTLNNIIYTDDCQIVHATIGKYYSFTPRFDLNIKFKELDLF